MSEIVECVRCGKRKENTYMSKDDPRFCIICYPLAVEEEEKQKSDGLDAAGQLDKISKRLEHMEITMADNASMLVGQLVKLRESIMQVSLTILTFGKLYAKSKGMVSDKDQTRKEDDENKSS